MTNFAHTYDPRSSMFVPVDWVSQVHLFIFVLFRFSAFLSPDRYIFRRHWGASVKPLSGFCLLHGTSLVSKKAISRTFGIADLPSQVGESVAQLFGFRFSSLNLSLIDKRRDRQNVCFLVRIFAWVWIRRRISPLVYQSCCCLIGRMFML